MDPLYLVLIIVGLPLLYVIYTYNRLVTKRNIVDNAWYQIDTLLQKRFDLVPNLVSTVQAYAKHEREVFENIAKARSAFKNASTVKDNASADNMFTGALKKLFAVSEGYPELKANQNFMMLQEELTGIENKIAYSRQRYNRSVMVFNTFIQRFPSNIIANLFKFGQRDYYQIDDGARDAVEVDM